MRNKSKLGECIENEQKKTEHKHGDERHLQEDIYYVENLKDNYHRYSSSKTHNPSLDTLML